jgi:hypothetical protein
MRLLNADRLLNRTRLAIGYLMIGEDDRDGPIPHGYRKVAHEYFSELRSETERLGLHVTVLLIDELLRKFQRAPERREATYLLRDAQHIADIMEKELSARIFVIVEPDHAKYFSATAPFGDQVETAFPTAAPEIADACKCFALQRYTASVFHLMRTLEVGLNALAAATGVPFQNQSWNRIIEQIENSIRSKSSSKHGEGWKEDEQFFSEAAAHFRVLKNAWRNYAMHLHERYDEERATDILNSVRAFMRHLATRLQE